VKSPVKYYTDQQFTALPLVERALITASSQKGVKETRANRGPMVDEYNKAGGAALGSPWCASFVSWCLIRAGVSRSDIMGKLGNPAWTYNWYKWAKKYGHLVVKPKRGDLFVWYNNKSGGHIGFIVEVYDDGSFRTLEGNTNDGGSREGIEVAERIRKGLPLADYKGFISIRNVWK